MLRNLTLPTQLLQRMVDWGREHRDKVEGDLDLFRMRRMRLASFCTWSPGLDSFCGGRCSLRHGSLRRICPLHAQAPAGPLIRLSLVPKSLQFAGVVLQDPDPLEVKGGWESPEIPQKVNMMRVICSPDDMDTIKPQVADCVKGLANYAQSLPTTPPVCGLCTAAPVLSKELPAAQLRIDIMAPGTNKAAGLHVLLEALLLI